MNLKDIFSSYRGKIDNLDLELIISHVMKKTREFVLIHLEQKITKNQELKTKNLIARRLKHEPLAYILGQKEFFGLPFKVNKHTLIPRPETELLVERAISDMRHATSDKNYSIVDVGTGSGNIIISLACNMKHKACNKFYGIDLSSGALKIAKQNARLNKVEKKVKFIKGDLLSPVISNPQSVIRKSKELIIIANLPYLSKKIYNATLPNVKNFEPKSALYSAKEGLAHYKKLFSQISKLSSVNSHQFTVFLEFSPEQKIKLDKLAKNFFPKAKLKFQRDLGGKWRILEIKI